MIQSVQAQNLEVEPNNFSWTGVLQAVSFAVRSAAHTTRGTKSTGYVPTYLENILNMHV